MLLHLFEQARGGGAAHRRPPLRQPSGVLWLYHVRPSLWFSFMAVLWMLHQSLPLPWGWLG
jgi:hypothetical protein